MKIGITCYPTYGGSGVVATELGMELAARGHEIHFISYAPPIRLNPNDAHLLSRSGSHHLPALRPRALHAGARRENDRSRRSRIARSAARPLRHSAFRQRAAGALDGCAAPLAFHHHASRHGHHAGRQRPQLSAHHEIFHRAIRRRHRHLAVSSERNARGIRHQAPHRSDPQFRELRSLLPQSRNPACARNGRPTANPS